METPDVSLDNVYPDLLHDYHCDTDDLLAEVERQRAVIAEQQAEIAHSREKAFDNEGEWIDRNGRLHDEIERLEQIIGEQQAEIAAMRPVVECKAQQEQQNGQAKAMFWLRGAIHRDDEIWVRAVPVSLVRYSESISQAGDTLALIAYESQRVRHELFVESSYLLPADLLAPDNGNEAQERANVEASYRIIKQRIRTIRHTEGW